MKQYKQTYSKPWLSFADQLQLLQSRGLVIADHQQAEAFLAHINYYRFSGYCLAFESKRHTFQPNTCFENIVAAYEFDRRLRSLIAQATAVVEIDIRTVIAHHFGSRYGAFGHTQAGNFFKKFDHGQWIIKLQEEADRSREPFVEHFKNKYQEYPDLPIWVITEIMSFGSLSKMFSGMNRADQRSITQQYRLQPFVMSSWLHHLVYIRNICAHHSRLWDRIWAIKPELPAGKNWQPPSFNNNNRVFTTIVILKYLLDKCPVMAGYANDWKLDIQDLLGNLPAARNADNLLGLETNWLEHPLWN